MGINLSFKYWIQSQFFGKTNVCATALPQSSLFKNSAELWGKCHYANSPIPPFCILRNRPGIVVSTSFGAWSNWTNAGLNKRLSSGTVASRREGWAAKRLLGGTAGQRSGRVGQKLGLHPKCEWLIVTQFCASLPSASFVQFDRVARIYSHEAESIRFC